MGWSDPLICSGAHGRPAMRRQVAAASRGSRAADSEKQRGAVLLEVVLALALFVAAAAVLTTGLSSSLDQVERLRLSAHAADLGISVLSELQMGTKSLATAGPHPFEAPLEEWTWEAVSAPLQSELEIANPLLRVEVVIRHQEPMLVHRISQVLSLPATNSLGESRGLSSF